MSAEPLREVVPDLDEPVLVVLLLEHGPRPEVDATVAAVFRLMLDAVAELTPGFQVIITDHADLPDDSDFQRAVVERWRAVQTKR